ncbi:MAG: DUF4407 domain-containing protein [Bacteroidia bacterium]|nr:DUF4407 domain-containing protein [Bacteroidia bacterium]
MKFLWFLATSDSKVLQEVEDKTERIWHSIIGTFVLITGIFAFITGSFTAKLIMNGPEAGPNSWMLPLGAGIVWAFLIITIDRLLIASIASERKNRIKKQQEDRSATAAKTGFLSRKMKSFSFILLRLGIALLISLIITKPFELWLFQDQIAKEGMTTAVEELKKSQEGLIETSQLSYLDEQLGKDSVKKEAVLLELDKAAKIDRYKQARKKQLWRISANNKAISRIKSLSDTRYIRVDSSYSPPRKSLNKQGRSRIQAYENGNREARNDTTRMRRELLAEGITEEELIFLSLDEMHDELDKVENNIERSERKKDREIQQINRQSQENKATIERSINDLFGKLDSLDDYIYNEEHPQRKYTSWFILFIFLSIESLPIVSKMLSSSGEYEQRVMARYSETLQEIEDQSQIREFQKGEMKSRISQLEDKIKSIASEEFKVEKFMEEFDRQPVM